MRQRLTPDIIDRHDIWRLYIEIQPQALEVVAYSTHHDQSLMHHRLPLDPAASSPLQALESVVYDNPLLLADFMRVSVLYDTKRYMIVPADLTDDVLRDMAEELWGKDITVLTNDLPVPGIKLMAAIDRGTNAFVTRTYPTTRPKHMMTTLITYFYNKGRMNNSPRMYLNLRNGVIDILIFSNGHLRMANSFEATNVDDIVYFVMFAAEKTGFDMHADELMVCGITSTRESVITRLREYVRYVMPVVFPSEMYHAGKDALASPFELIIMPLCE